MNATPGLCNSV